MSKCVRIPHVKVGDSYQPSLLYQDLQKFLKDRALVKEWYAVATNPSILEDIENTGNLRLNEQGQITLACLRENIPDVIQDDDYIQQLREQNNGYYSYDAAIERVQHLNRTALSTRSDKSNYMAILSIDKNDSNTFRVEIVDRNEQNLRKLENVISTRNVIERIIFYCRDKGIDISTVSDIENGYIARYDSSPDSEGKWKMENDLFQLISIAEGLGDQETKRAVSSTAGHFAIASMINSPLVQRLLTTLEGNETLVEELGKAYGVPYDASDRQDLIELAGRLVADSLSSEEDIKSKIGRTWDRIGALLSRIGKWIANVFKRGIKANDVYQLQSQIDNIRKQSSDIARGFMTSIDNTSSIQDAVSLEETFDVIRDSKFLKNNTLNKKVYASVINALDNAIEQLYSINGATVSDLVAIKKEGLKAYDADPSIGAEVSALQAIARMVNDLQGTLESLQEQLVLIDERAAYFDNTRIPEYATMLRDARIKVKTILDIMSTLRQFVPYADTQQGGPSIISGTTNVRVNYPDGTSIDIDLSAVLQESTEKLGHLSRLTQNKMNYVFSKFLEIVIGGKYVKIAAHKIFKGFLKLEKVSERNVTPDDILREFSTDTSLFERFFASTSSKDLFQQYMDKHAKMTEKKINTSIRMDRNSILELEGTWKEVFGNRRTDILYERHETDLYYLDESTGTIIGKTEYEELSESEQHKYKNMKGRLSGNFRVIDDYVATKDFAEGRYGINYGDWELAREYFEQKTKRDFISQNKDKLKEWSENQRALEYDNYRKPLYKEWRKVHCELTKVGDSWRLQPSRFKYIYDKEGDNHAIVSEMLIDSEKMDLFQQIADFKMGLDDLLPKGSIPSHRVPQFNTTTLADGIRNRSYMDKKNRFLDHMISKMRDNIAGTVEDIEFGSLDTYNRPSDMTFEDAYILRNEGVNRLPIYGVNKLKNIDNLSTNLFHNLLSYSVMSRTYEGISESVNVYEMAKDVLSDVAQTKKTDVSYESTESYKSYQQFLDKHIYRKQQYIAFHNAVNRFAAFIRRLAGLYFLGGNVAGAAVNLGTAVNELFKEAGCSQFFNLKDAAVAFKYFTKHSPAYLLDYIHEDAKSELGLFMEMVDYAGDFKNQMLSSRKFHNGLFNKAARFFDVSDSLMLPYKTGDLFIQSIGYLSMFNHTKVYDVKGKPTSLLSLFKKYSKEGKGKQMLHDIGMGNGVWFKRTKQFEEMYKKGNTRESYTPQEVYNKANDAINQLLSREESGRISYALNDIVNDPILLDIISKKDKDYNIHNINTYGSQQLIDLLQDVIKDTVWNEKDTSDLIEKARTITIRMHGVYNSYDQVGAQQYLLGNLFLQMKGYAIGMITRRFGRNKYSATLDDVTEGSLNTVLKVLLDFNKSDIGVMQKRDIHGLNKLLLLVCPWFDHCKNVMMRAGYSETQFYNMRRNALDMYVTASLFTLKTLLLGIIHGWDDPEEDYVSYEAYQEWKDKTDKADKFFDRHALAQGSYYLVSRLYAEQSAFNNPGYWTKEYKALLGAIPVSVASALDLGQFMYLYTGYAIAAQDDIYNYEDPKEYYEAHKEFIYQKADSYFQKGDPKYLKYAKRVPWLRSYYQVVQGEENAKNYLYVRSGGGYR